MICLRHFHDLCVRISQAFVRIISDYLFKLAKMTERYVQLMQDLQYSKRQTANWRQKSSLIETELTTVLQECKQMKKTIQKLQQSNNKLTMVNKQLIDDKESIITDYSSQISTIKEEINRKQKEIMELKQTTSPTSIDQNLALRQMKHQLSEQYGKQMEGKQRKIQQLIALVDRLSYEKEIQREKYGLKIKSLENQMRDRQLRCDAQILEYSNKLYTQAQSKPSQDKELTKRTRRENEQLRKKQQLLNQQLQSALEQKNRVHKDYSKWMNQHKKYVTDSQVEIQTYKAEIQRIAACLEKNSTNRDDLILRDKDREIKRWKTENEELRDEMLRKDKKIGDLEVDVLRVQNQIKNVRHTSDIVNSQIQENVKNQRDRLQRELYETRQTLQKVKNQNLQLSDKIFEINKNNANSKQRWDQLHLKEQEQLKNKLKRQLSEQELKPINQYSRQDVPNNQNNSKQEKQFEEQVKSEKGKVKDILMKYLQMKKMYEKAEKKLKKANDKIIQLLQTKIVLGSPKATTKKFQFPTTEDKSPHNKHKISIQKYKHNNQQQASFQQQFFSNSPIQQEQGYQTSNQFIPYRPAQINAHSRTNPTFNRQFLSPQEQKHIRIEEHSVQGEHSYYERSMKLKNNQKYRELKCANHQQEQCLG